MKIAELIGFLVYFNYIRMRARIFSYSYAIKIYKKPYQPYYIGYFSPVKAVVGFVQKWAKIGKMEAI